MTAENTTSATSSSTTVTSSTTSTTTSKLVEFYSKFTGLTCKLGTKQNLSFYGRIIEVNDIGFLLIKHEEKKIEAHVNLFDIAAIAVVNEGVNND